MIKASGITVEKEKDGKRYVKCSLNADTGAEIKANGTDVTNIVGLRPTDEMTAFSTCLCADGDFVMLNSSGVWQ